ncbi:MAG TPA: MBL fold metallo-hydrolase [Thermoanaerobaculia bacterium]|nr:MBL fold metallo-hydrolase [Thermoanaerobaculia bacterium]
MIRDTEALWLRPNVVAEPLVNQWYAWPYLISPMTAPLYVSNLQMRILESFVAAPGEHGAAVADPARAAGPFLDCDPSRVGEVRDLIERTRRRQGRLLAFADAAARLGELLGAEGRGESLVPLYALVPDELRGYVELVYDVASRPAVRFLEGLLYQSPYYDDSVQAISLSLAHVDGRGFVFSTPRLPDDEHFQIDLPLRERGLDALFGMREAPLPFGELRESLALGEREGAALARFLTDEAPAAREPWTRDETRVRYFGHACVLVETRGFSILVDPVVSATPDSGIQRFTYEDLPETVDVVAVTQARQDHCMLETLLELRRKARHVVVPKSGGSPADPSLKLALRALGFPSVVELDEMESLALPSGSVTSVPCLGGHGDLDVRGKSAYLVRSGGRSIFLAGDSSAVAPELYGHLHALFGDLDVAFVGMEHDGPTLSWLYGPLLPEPLPARAEASRLLDGADARRALALVERLKPAAVYVYAMGAEPWLRSFASEETREPREAELFVAACAGRGVPAELLFGRREIVVGADGVEAAETAEPLEVAR